MWVVAKAVSLSAANSFLFQVFSPMEEEMSWFAVLAFP